MNDRGSRLPQKKSMGIQNSPMRQHIFVFRPVPKNNTLASFAAEHIKPSSVDVHFVASTHDASGDENPEFSTHTIMNAHETIRDNHLTVTKCLPGTAHAQISECKWNMRS